MCAAPGDDLSRLVLCDWWEERGQAERARWVQTSVAQAANTPCETCLNWQNTDPRPGRNHLNGTRPLQLPSPYCGACRRLRAAALWAGRHLPRGGALSWFRAMGWPVCVGPTVHQNGMYVVDRGWPWCATFHSWADFDAACSAGLWARVPVARVEWPGLHSDIQPWPGGEPYPAGLFARCWAEARTQSERPTSPFLPRKIWARLSGGATGLSRDGLVERFYAHVDHADEALSRACVDEGRAAAGLDPLAWPEWAESVGAVAVDEDAALTDEQYASLHTNTPVD